MEITEIQVDGYEKVVRCQDPESGLHALIAIHDTTLGPALGGMRMWPYASEDEALFDVLRLSKGMTYKSAVAETGLGGGKSVILGDPKTMKSEKLFRAMGRFVDSLGGRYITAEDMNIGIPDLDIVHKETKWVTGLARAEGSSGNPSPYTAEGCLIGLRAVVEELDGTTDLSGKHVLIQGVGAVGGALAVMLKEAGAKVTICDINDARVEELCKEYGFDAVDDEAHLDVTCDIYAPCARGAGLNDDTIPKLKCRAIAGCANNQLLEPRHAQALKDRGILYAPDYVLNAGGIINVGVELLPGGYDENEARRRIARIYDNLKLVFEIARNENIPTSEAAERLARQRIEAARQTS
ncbi:MAG: Glu/Leu/Phe/Val dehydrogenase [Planctomycetes bacterium]|nr:Glu/Leu/Phe/Val dehydrogenase [Planctomycetota bacterium]